MPRFLIALWLLLTGAAFSPAAEKPPRRLISICLPGDQLLLQLVPREEIAAVSYLAADPDLSPHWKEAAGIPATRGNAEELAALRPDLVIAGKYTTPGTVAVLRRLGIPVVEVGFPRTFEELRAQIREAAAALGAQERGERLIAAMDARLARLTAQSAGKDRPTALFYFQDGYTPGADTFAGALLEAAGYRNLGPAAGGNEAPSTPMERVLLSRPDRLLLVNYREKSPTFTEISVRHPILQKLAGTKIDTIPFRHLACPDPANLDLVEAMRVQPPAPSVSPR